MTTYQYTTATKVEEEIRATTPFASTTVPSLTTVTDWIAQESAQVNLDAGMVFGETQHTSTIDYSGQERIVLKQAPIITINSLTYATTRIGTTDYATSFVEKTEDTDFVVYNERGEIVPLFNNWSPAVGMKRIKLDFSAGFEEIPLTVEKLTTKQVALRVMDSLVNNNTNDSNAGGSISVGSISIVEPANLSLSSYKQIGSDIDSLKQDISKTFGVHRYNLVY